tara:strand:- start:1312 stop:1470 length:159 start_codon:yes stop_codon:yes gene_type:complete
MDKETLIRLATPASIVLLALSIFSIPFMGKADVTSYGIGENSYYPLYVKLVN